MKDNNFIVWNQQKTINVNEYLKSGYQVNTEIDNGKILVEIRKF